VPCDADELARAIRVLAAGGLVAFPTETVWGLAADARQPGAVERLRHFKGRDPAQPISLIVADTGALSALGCTVGSAASALIEAFWPGPVTLVLPIAAEAPLAALAPAGGGLGIRFSPHPVAAALARAAADAGIGPLTATSCNLCGSPAAETRAQARAVCTGDGEPPFVLESGDDAYGGDASTVVDLCAAPPRILREGPLARAVEEVLARVSKAAAEPATAGRA
jgi:L-threonylcarbamoyladenylate synthase